MDSEPTVSVIISAYNRPSVMEFAIKSVLASDFEDWELIVVGDGCNAETEAAVRAFTDPRIHFHNLPANTGHQSAPHNKGVELARGNFILFLNQDDMYFPDHITKRIAFMRESGADISWCPIILLQHSGLVTGAPDVGQDRIALDGAVADGRFNPRSFIISSSWAVRRSVCLEVGPWLPINETRLSPSQEWLYRAYRQGKHMAYHSNASVLCIHSGVRRYSYVSAQSQEHERAWSWLLAGERAKSELLHCIAVQQASEIIKLRKSLNRRKRPLRTLIEKTLEKRGIHPDSLQRYFEGLSKGGWVRNHKKFTTEPPELKLNKAISFSTDAADDLIGSGWHKKEENGRWSAKDIAEVFFTVPDSAGNLENLTLQICGHPFLAGDEVTFILNDGTRMTQKVGASDEVINIPLHRAGAYHLMITVENSSRSHESKGQVEDRTLGFWLTWLQITDVPA